MSEGCFDFGLLFGFFKEVDLNWDDRWVKSET